MLIDAGWSSPVARWAHNPKVAGSNPAPATKTSEISDQGFEISEAYRGCSSVGRAPRLQRGGQGFESPHLHHGQRLRISNLRSQISDLKHHDAHRNLSAHRSATRYSF